MGGCRAKNDLSHDDLSVFEPMNETSSNLLSDRLFDNLHLVIIAHMGGH